MIYTQRGHKMVSKNMQIIKIGNEIIAEAQKATTKYPSFNSCHEGAAILKEEYDELWEEVRAMKNSINPTVEQQTKARNEAIQVGAMALRFVLDMCNNNKKVT